MPPLEGILILDSAHQYPGPYCSMLLGDLGAEVIKIERPDGGDPTRSIPWPGFFRALNRNKRSLTLDLKRPEARGVLLKLAARADVFTEGFRPGVAGRLGIGYDTLAAANPRLVYCSITGYGQDGPYRDLPGHDLSYLGMAGILDRLRDGVGDPVVPGIAAADLSSGMFAALGILAALTAREKTGRGQYLDVSMFDGLVSWMGVALGLYFDRGDRKRGVMAGYGVYRAGDGRHVTISITHEDWFWDRLCDALGLDGYRGIGAGDRITRGEELDGALRALFATRPAREWVEILEKADVPVSPVKSVGEVADDPHVRARGMLEEVALPGGEISRQASFPVRLSETPASIRRPPPSLGEHTDEILAWLGYDRDGIDDLRRKGAL